MNLSSVLSLLREVPAAACFVFITVMLWICGASSEVFANWVKLSPAKAGLTDFYLWAIATGGLFESSFLMVLLKLPVCALLFAKLERACGSVWVSTYTLAAIVLSGFVSSSIRVFLYLFHAEEKYLFHDMYGLGGTIVSLLIANVLVDPSGKVLNKVEYRLCLLPLISFYILLWLSEVEEVYDLVFVMTSFFVSFAYLRRKKPTCAITNADEITIDVFFPNTVRPVIKARFGCLIYGKSQSSMGLNGSNSSHLPTTLPKVITSDPVGERRRARALQALDKKLAEISKEPEISLDGDVDDDN